MQHITNVALFLEQNIDLNYVSNDFPLEFNGNEDWLYMG